MRAAAVAVLARSTTPGERTRHRLLVAAVAAAGALLLASGRIARLGEPGPDASLTPFVVDRGLRFGVVLGGLLVVVPVLVFAVQALRLGSAQRTRRLDALRLAGAAPSDLRRVAAGQTGWAGLLGGLLAGPAYVVLWVVLGVLPAAGMRLLPTPDAVDLPVWAGIALLGAVGGALAGAATAGGTRRSPGLRGGARWVAAAAVTAVVVGTLVVALTATGAALLGLVLLVPVALVVLGPPVAVVLARRSARGGDPVALLAVARLGADPGPAGRVAGVLAVCGFAWGVQGALVAQTVSRGDRAFYLAGTGLATAATLVAVAAGVMSLLVAAADQVVGARRSAAALHAMGVEPAVHRQVLRRQLTAVSVPAVVAGALAGEVPFGAAMLAGVDQGPVGLLVLVLVAPLAALATAVVAALAVRCVHGWLADATGPESLRAP